MIIWNGREIAPQKIKRIQLGDKIVYVRRSKLGIKTGFEFDFETDMKNAFSVPMETDMGFVFALVSSPETELHVTASDISGIDFDTQFGTEQELYVELTSPMMLDEKVVFVMDPEVVSAKANVCKMNEELDFVFVPELNAPAAIGAGQEEIADFEIRLAAKAATADCDFLEKEFEVFGFGAEAEIRPAGTVLFEGTSEISAGICGEAKTAETVFSEAFCKIKIEIEAELWIKPGEWVYPVLKKRVLGITQALSTVQSGNIIKIF